MLLNVQLLFKIGLSAAIVLRVYIMRQLQQGSINMSGE